MVDSAVNAESEPFKGEHTSKMFVYNEAEPLGSGGYGSVFACQDEDGRPFAAKVVILRKGTKDFEHAWREIEILDDLRQRQLAHLMPMIDRAYTGDKLIFVMPKALRSLSDLADERRLDYAEVTDIALQVCDGMDSLAEARIIHRDLKPSNILECDGEWLVSDFGISRAQAERTATVTFRGTGTLSYRAPETFRGQPESQATDFYSLGCTFYELISGQQAFPSSADVHLRHFYEQPKLPSECPLGLRTAIQSLMAKNPKARPRSVDDVRRLIVGEHGLSPIQRKLFEFRAREEQRKVAIALEESRAEMERNHDREAFGQVIALWNDFAASLGQVYPEVSQERERDRFLISFDSKAISFERFMGRTYYTADHPRLFFCADVKVWSENRRVEAANLYSILDVDGNPQLRVIRFNIPRFVPGYDDVGEQRFVTLPGSLNAHYMGHDYPEFGPTFGGDVLTDELATADALMELLVEILEDANKGLGF